MEEYIAKKMAEAKVKNKNNSASNEAQRKLKEKKQRKEKEESERKEKEESERKEKEESERKEKEESERKEKEEKLDEKSLAIPEMVFIVPYRNRRQQRDFFVSQMKFVLEDVSSDKYEIFYIHQTDNRGFNRGAMKNIGYLMLKDRYPDNYKDICIIFNDVDTMPYKKNFLNYKTHHGIVKHFYGFKYALGGIVSITGGDFEKTKG